jgi:hypothetical protein
MRFRRGHFRLLATSALLAVLGLGTAQAQSDAENRAAARALGIEGISLAMTGKCSEAIDKLERAEQLYHAPTILERLGECQIELGQIVAGTENLQRVLREPLGPNPPAAYREAQERARKALDQALPRIAKLTVNVTAPPGATYEVTLNGKTLPVALVGVERPIDPGEYQVVVSGEGLVPMQQSVTLATGAAESVTLTVAAVPPETTTPGPITEPPPVTPPPSAGGGSNHGKTLRIAGFALIGVGGVGIVGGTVFGLQAMGKKSDLDDTCLNSVCPPAAQDDIDALKSSATLSTVGFGVGLGAAAVGTVLVLQPWSTRERSAGIDDRSAPWGGVQAFVAPNGVGLRGQF